MRPFALAAIAHAAFARVRSTKSSAAQRFSPNRPLDQAETGGLQTDLFTEACLNHQDADKTDLHERASYVRLPVAQEDRNDHFFLIPDMAGEDVFQGLATFVQICELVACDRWAG